MDDIAGKHGNYQAVRSSKGWFDYCQKEGDFLQWGDIDINEEELARKGKRKHLGEQLISGKKTLLECVNDDASLIFNLSNLERDLQTYNRLKQDSIITMTRTIPKLILLTGKSGIGKTTMACEPKLGTSIYIVPLPQNGQWFFNQYNGHTRIVFDNMSKDLIPPYDLILRLVDTQTCSVPTKYGGFVNLIPKEVVMTGVGDPSRWWTQCDDQFWRRCDKWYIGSGKQPNTEWKKAPLLAKPSTTVSEETNIIEATLFD